MQPVVILNLIASRLRRRPRSVAADLPRGEESVDHHKEVVLAVLVGLGLLALVLAVWLVS
jgi:hypothetical protein